MKVNRNPFPVRKKELVVVRNPKGMTIYPMPKHNFGGHLPYPPEDCDKKKYWFQHDGVNWIDLNICHNCPKIKTCDKRKTYIKSLSDKRKHHFKSLTPNKEKKE